MKKILKIIWIHLLASFLAMVFLITFATSFLSFPSNVPNWENVSWLFEKYFNNILVKPSNINDWLVKKSRTIINQQCNDWQVLQWFYSNWVMICVNN